MLIYQDVNNSELEEMLISNIIRYNVLVKSEQIAKVILDKYGQRFISQNKGFKESYNDLLLCAKLRGVRIPYEYSNVSVELDDIVERIRENEVGVIDIIRKYASSYYGYLGEGVFSEDKSFDNYQGLNKRQEEISALYDTIVSDILMSYGKTREI